jgi:hypothetical protein
MHCPQCGLSFDKTSCPVCSGDWEAWELLLAAIPQTDLRERVSGWISRLPSPAVVQIRADTDGLRVVLFLPPGKGQGIVQSWASLVQQQSRWLRSPSLALVESTVVLHSLQKMPVLGMRQGDPFLTLGGHLLGQVQGGEVALNVWILGTDNDLQQKLRTLSAYNYGSDSGVGAGLVPNPWGMRLRLFQFFILLGILMAGISGGLIAAGWVQSMKGLLGISGGILLMLVGWKGLADWLQLRSVPKEVLECFTKEPLMRIAVSYSGERNTRLPDLLSGKTEWVPIGTAWPKVRAYAISLPASDIAALITPPQGEGSGLIASDVIQDVPAPPPTRALRTARFTIGQSVATGEDIGIDPDGHGIATGGSRTGKSSFVFNLLRQLASQGEEAPGIFLVDPHLSLADGFLEVINSMPSKQRKKAIKRLRIISPDQPEVIPLNLMCVADFSWAGNSIVQIGRRIWEDYWGPRMQAALLGLFKLAHAWNQHQPQQTMGLLHVVFAAFNAEWRHTAMGYLPPVERMGSLALDALLGQLKQESGGKWDQGWVTEVISPVLSKVMALELCPWLFASMHQGSFVNMERWVQEKAWVILRLPSGTMGREGARLTASIVYNIFEAAFRKVTLNNPVPFYFFIDEAQEIATGMRLESMLAEGAKFGARMFVMSQSLSMMRRIEGYESVVQALLANTSTQAFFSPDPEDSDLIRATLSSKLRYGDTTLDLPSLQCWLRARLGGRWQPPVLAKIKPLIRSDPERVETLIREVIAAHPEDYAHAEFWQESAVKTLQAMIPPAYRAMLSPMFSADFSSWGLEGGGEGRAPDIKGSSGTTPENDPLRLGL